MRKLMISFFLITCSCFVPSNDFERLLEKGRKVRYCPSDNEKIKTMKELENSCGNCVDHAWYAYYGFAKQGLRAEFVIGIYDCSSGVGRHAWAETEDEKGRFIVDLTQKLGPIRNLNDRCYIKGTTPYEYHIKINDVLRREEENEKRND